MKMIYSSLTTLLTVIFLMVAAGAAKSAEWPKETPWGLQCQNNEQCKGHKVTGEQSVCRKKIKSNKWSSKNQYCLKKLWNKAPCNNSDQCTSGNCARGVCTKSPAADSEATPSASSKSREWPKKTKWGLRCLNNGHCKDIKARGKPSVCRKKVKNNKWRSKNQYCLKKLWNKAPCNNSDQCISGNCARDVCTKSSAADSKVPPVTSSAQDRQTEDDLFDYQRNEKFTPLSISKKQLNPSYQRSQLNKLRHTARPSDLFFSLDVSRPDWLWTDLANRAYDRKLNWSWADPKGFGRFNRVSIQAQNILAVVNHGGLLFGSMLTPGASTKNTGCLSNLDCFVWEEIGTRLKSPGFIADAAFKAHHPQSGKTEIVTIIPSDEDSGKVKMYETNNMGDSWQEIKIANPRGGYFTLRNQASGYGGNDINELHQFPVKAPGTSRFRMFYYNYNDIEDQYGYYYDGIQWKPSTFDQLSPASNGNLIPNYAQQTYFTQKKYGLLSPQTNLIFVTDDFGKSWTQVLNLNGLSISVANFGFAITEDGKTIYVAVNENPKKTKVYFMKGTRQSNGGYVFSAPEMLPEQYTYGVQFASVNLNNNNDVTLWYYMDGPVNINNADASVSEFNLSRLFPSSSTYMDSDYYEKGNEFFINGAPYYMSMEYRGLTGEQKNKPGVIVPLPIDVREIFRHPTHSGETLIASDQGLYLVGQKVKKKEKDPKSGKVKVHAFDVYLKNLAESRDHSEVYGVEVDACGCVYAGQWHGSATFTCGLSWVYRGGEAKGLFTGKNRLTCDKGNEWISNWGELNEKTTFRTYATRCKDNPQLFCKRKIMSTSELSVHAQLDDPPTVGLDYPKMNTPAIYVELTKNPIPDNWEGFKPGGYFIYKARNGNLYLRPAGIDDLKKFPQKARSLLSGKIYKLALDDKTNELYVLASDKSSTKPKVLFKNDLKGGGWQLVLEDGFKGDIYNSVYDISTSVTHKFDSTSKIDAYDGQVVVTAIPQTSDGRRTVCVLNDKLTNTGSGPHCYMLLASKADNASKYQNPWESLPNKDKAFYEQVVIDRVCPTRLYTVLRNQKTVRHCTQQVLISDAYFSTEGTDQYSVRSWKQFGDKLQCGVIRDIEFDPKRKLIYVASHGRGVMKGSLEELHCPDS